MGYRYAMSFMLTRLGDGKNAPRLQGVVSEVYEADEEIADLYGLRQAEDWIARMYAYTGAIQVNFIGGMQLPSPRKKKPAPQGWGMITAGHY